MYGVALDLALMVSLMRAVQTAGPAMPSTVRLFCVWNASTAALVISFAEPCVHCEVSSAGMLGQRQAKVPGWSVARSGFDGAGPLGVKLTGRKLSPASSCWRRSSSPATTSKETVLDRDSLAPFSLRTPVEPPGIVTTTCDDGMSGESSS